LNTQKIAAALRALADAIETPVSANTAVAPATAATPTGEAASEKPKRGRPPNPSAAPVAAAALAPAPVTTPVVAAVAVVATSAAPAPAATGLTHATVAGDFKTAAAKHGRDFVVSLMKAHSAPTFDKVKDLATFQAQLRAGPPTVAQAAVDDLMG
jgi:hypothetical protein